MEESKNIDVSILNLSGYFQKHFKLCQTHRTQLEAFNALEDEYKELVKKPRFTSYESFRTAKSRYYKNSYNR